MTLEQAIRLLVTVTLIEMMVAIGLGVTWAELRNVARNWRLLLRALLANYVLVPAATVALLIAFQAQPLAAAGFLILAVCPGAPFIPPITALAKGDVPVAVGLMALLAGTSAVIAPVLLQFLLPYLAGSAAPPVNAVQLVSTLGVTQLAPLCLGLAVRHWRPALADRLQQPAGALSKLLNLLSVGAILATQFPMLATIRFRGLAGMTVLLIVSLLAGWWLGGPARDIRTTLSLTTALRNVGVSLVIATAAFAGTPAVTAVIAYGLFGIAGSLVLASWWGRHPASAVARQESPEPTPCAAGGVSALVGGPRSTTWHSSATDLTEDRR